MRVELYGVLGERAGCGEVELAIEMPATVTRVLEELGSQYPRLAGDLPRAACAVGDALVRRDETVSGAEPLVVLPPVSGG